MGAESKAQQGQKLQDSQQPTGDKEKAGGSSNQGAGKRKPQDKDNKEKNKRRRPDKAAVMKAIRFKLLCFETQAGAVIGKGGDTVRTIRKNTCAEVTVLPPQQGHRFRVVLIDSAAGNRAAPTYPAKEALLTAATLTIEGDQPLHAPDPSQHVEVRMLVQSEITAGLLGRKHKPGSFTAGDISAQCGANVIMPPDSDRPSVAESDEEYLLLRGPWPSVYAALGMVADEVRREFYELRDHSGDPSHAPAQTGFGFGGPPPMAMVPGPFDPMEAMQLGIGLGMEMAVAAAAGVAAGGARLGAPMHSNGPLLLDGGGGQSAPPQAGDLAVAGLIPEFRSPAEASTPVTVTFKLVVPESRAGRFIGKGGENLRELRQTLGLSTLKVHPAVKDTGVRVLEVSSTDPAASTRCAAVEALLYYVNNLAQCAAGNSGAGGRGRLTVKLLLHQMFCGPVVGPRAANIRQISALTNTSCVVHKKGDLPPYGTADEQELEAEGDAANLMEAIKVVAAVIRGCELRRMGITVRETFGTPEFDMVRQGAPPPAHGPLGPMAPALRGGMDPESNWGTSEARGHSGPGAGSSGPSMTPLMQQRQPQHQQPPPDLYHRQSKLQHEELYVQAQGQQLQLPPHLQQQQQQQQQQQPSMKQGARPNSDKGSAAGGAGVTGLPPLGPNDVRLTIFVAAALVNAPEGINGTNVQQVQAVTNTMITLRQPVASGDYELDITGTLAQVTQAHTLLSNIMTIGAILQQKPQLAPQQAPPPAISAAATAAASGQPVTSVPALPAVSGAGGAQHQVVVQPNQGVVVTTQQPQQRPVPVAVQSPTNPSQVSQQKSAVQQSQQQQQVPHGQVLTQATAPSQGTAAYATPVQQPSQQQQTAQQTQLSPQRHQQVPAQQAQVQPPPQATQAQQQAQQTRPVQQAEPSAQQPKNQQPRSQQYAYNAEPTVPTQQDTGTQRPAQVPLQAYPAQQPNHAQQAQQAAAQPAAPSAAATYEQQQYGQATNYPYSGATQSTLQAPRQDQLQQQYATPQQSNTQLPQQSQYGQPYAAYPQQQQVQQHPYYQQQQAQAAQQQQAQAAQQQQGQAAHSYPAYGSQGYGTTGGAAQTQAVAAVTAAASTQAGVQTPASAAYGSEYSQGAAAPTAQPPSSGASTAAGSGAATTATAYGSQQQQYQGYGAAAYQSAPQANHPYYQAAPPQQQQQPVAQSTHEQYYMQMQQQYAAYQAAAAATSAGAAYPPATYGYGYGAPAAPASQ